jgi:hypothetical protein
MSVSLIYHSVDIVEPGTSMKVGFAQHGEGVKDVVKEDMTKVVAALNYEHQQRRHLATFVDQPLMKSLTAMPCGSFRTKDPLLAQFQFPFLVVIARASIIL